MTITAVIRMAALLALAPQSFGATAQTLTGFPFTEETLGFSLKWPTGEQLGEARLHSKYATGGWEFELSLEAGIPGFEVRDSYSARANADFCTSELTRHFVHGPRKGGEKETVDRSHATVSRVTEGGGSGDFSVGDCTKDALTLLFYARRELGQGRVPGTREMLFGGLYQTSLRYAGPETIQSSGKPVVTDKVLVEVKGAANSVQFEMWFARDAARTPLLVKVPFAIGKFSMELVR